MVFLENTDRGEIRAVTSRRKNTAHILCTNVRDFLFYFKPVLVGERSGNPIKSKFPVGPPGKFPRSPWSFAERGLRIIAGRRRT